MKHPLPNLWFVLLLLSAIFMTAPVRATDVSITATSVAPSANAKTIRRLAAVAVTAGKLVYIEAATNQLKLADADSATEEVRKVAGIAVTSGAVGTWISVVTEDPALTLGGTAAKGTVYVLSATAGGIAPLADLTTGWYAHIIAVGVSSTVVAFDAGKLQTGVAQ